jgi:hypothetical protein
LRTSSHFVAVWSLDNSVALSHSCLPRSWSFIALIDIALYGDNGSLGLFVKVEQRLDWRASTGFGKVKVARDRIVMNVVASGMAIPVLWHTWTARSQVLPAIEY